jgi:hypothetical protein
VDAKSPTDSKNASTTLQATKHNNIQSKLHTTHSTDEIHDDATSSEAQSTQNKIQKKLRVSKKAENYSQKKLKDIVNEEKGAKKAALVLTELAASSGSDSLSKKRKKVGRKAGVPSVIAAKTIARRVENDVYAFVEFCDEESANNACILPARIFGIHIAKSMCRTLPAAEARTLYLTVLNGSAVQGEIEYWVNRHLAPHLHARTQRGATSLIEETSPDKCTLLFPTHEAALWAYQKLNGQSLVRQSPAEPTRFTVQWQIISERTAQHCAAEQFGAN